MITITEEETDTERQSSLQGHTLTQSPSIVIGPVCHCTTLYIPVLQLCTFHDDHTIMSHFTVNF